MAQLCSVAAPRGGPRCSRYELNPFPDDSPATASPAADATGEDPAVAGEDGNLTVGAHSCAPGAGGAFQRSGEAATHASENAARRRAGHRTYRAANARPARPLSARARGGAAAVAAANRAAALAANSHEAALARDKALFIGGSPDGDGPHGGGRRAARGPEEPGREPSLSPAAQRARRREGAARFGRKALAAFMAVVLAVGLMPLPAFGDDGRVRGVSFNGNLIAGSISTTTTVDADGVETTETTRTKVDDEGNVVSETETGSGGGLDSDANLRGQRLLGQATALKSDGTIQDLAGTDIGKVSEESDARLSVAAGAQAQKDREDEERQAKVDEAQAAFEAEDAAIDIGDLGDLDFSSQRIVVVLKDGASLQERDLNNVTSRADDMYVLAYKDADAAKRAYARYARYDGAAFAAPDVAVQASDGEDGDDSDGDDPDPVDVPRTGSGDVDKTRVADDAPGAEGATQPGTDAPEVDTSTYEQDKRQIEQAAGDLEGEGTPGPDGQERAVVVLIDTMVAQDYEGVERYSVINAEQETVADDDPDRDAKVAAQHDTHGSRMLDAIREQAPDAEVVSIEALDPSNYGCAASVLMAAQLALAAAPDVANMSFAGYATEGNAAISEAVKVLAQGPDGEAGTADDAAVVAAAGNEGADAKLFVPASSAGATAVGALDAGKVEALRESTARELFGGGDLSLDDSQAAELDSAVAGRVTADPDAYRLASSNRGGSVAAWAIADSTSLAAARASGYAAANGGSLDGLAESPLAAGGAREFAAADAGGGDGQESPDTPSEYQGQDSAAEGDDTQSSPDTNIKDPQGGLVAGVVDEVAGELAGQPAPLLTSLIGEVGVRAADGAVTVNLGNTFTKNTAESRTYEYYNGSAYTTTTSVNWFKFATPSITETSSQDITRITITSSAATSTSGIFIYVPASASGYDYFVSSDTLSTTTARHKEYVVVFKTAINGSSASNFIRDYVTFFTPAGEPTPQRIHDGATINVKVDCASNSNLSSKIYDTSKMLQYRISNPKSGDSAVHFYGMSKKIGNRNTSNADMTACFKTHYDNAKTVFLDGMRGYVATETSSDEHSQLYTLTQNNLGAGQSNGDRWAAIGLMTHTVKAGSAFTAYDADTFSGTTDHLSSTRRWQCGPEAGDALNPSFYGSGQPNQGNGSITGENWGALSWDDDYGAYWSIIEFSGYKRTVSATGNSDFVVSLPYSVSYNSNGGSNAMSTDSGFMTFQGLKALTANAFVRDGYHYLGWAETAARANAGTVDYADGATPNTGMYNGSEITSEQTITLYAVWSPNTYSIKFRNATTAGSPTDESFVREVKDSTWNDADANAGYYAYDPTDGSTAAAYRLDKPEGYHFKGWRFTVKGDSAGAESEWSTDREVLLADLPSTPLNNLVVGGQTGDAQAANRMKPTANTVTGRSVTWRTHGAQAEAVVEWEPDDYTVVPEGDEPAAGLGGCRQEARCGPVQARWARTCGRGGRR